MKEKKFWIGIIISILISILIVVSYKIFFAEKITYERAKRTQKLGDYEFYYNKYPNGKFIDEVTNSICYLVERIETYEINGDTIYRVYEYIDKYRNTSLEAGLVAIAYNKMNELNTEKWWQFFIDNVPYQYQSYGEERIAQLEYERWGTDENSWNTVCKINTIEGYLAYMNMYPQGQHYKDAEKRYIDLVVAHDFAHEHGTLPKMSSQSRNTRNGYSEVQIKNQTEYLLTIYYSGPQSKKIEIASNGSKYVRLKNGRYKLSARVRASNVLPFVGEEYLEGSYGSTFYIQPREMNINIEMPNIAYDF